MLFRVLYITQYWWDSHWPGVNVMLKCSAEGLNLHIPSNIRLVVRNLQITAFIHSDSPDSDGQG